MNTYQMAKRLIETGRTNNLMAKLDLWLGMDRMTIEQYNELVGMLPTENG